MNGCCSGTHISNQVVELSCCDPQQAAAALPLAEPLLRSALAHTGIGDYRDIENGILAGEQLLWLALSGRDTLAAASTQLQSSAVGKICVITACGGRAIREWLHLIEKIESYATAEGCERVRYFGRRGWLRELEGYSQVGVIADKPLTESSKTLILQA